VNVHKKDASDKRAGFFFPARLLLGKGMKDQNEWRNRLSGQTI
jgi:hypothetical protein